MAAEEPDQASPAPVERVLDRLVSATSWIWLALIAVIVLAVVLRFVDTLELDLDQVDVNGGAIAMGHPLGATGAIILGTLLDEMERQEKSLGCAALCVGAGMGTATIIERV